MKTEREQHRPTVYCLVLLFALCTEESGSRDARRWRTKTRQWRGDGFNNSAKGERRSRSKETKTTTANAVNKKSELKQGREQSKKGKRKAAQKEQRLARADEHSRRKKDPVKLETRP